MYALFYDNENKLNYKGIVKNEKSNEVCLSSIPKGENEVAYLFCNQDAYSSYCKEYNEYWDWIEKRNEERYNTNQQHGKNYDSKNMMHTIRLLQSALQIATTNSLQIKVSNREELLNIKQGKLDYDALLQLADELLEKIEFAFNHSTLPQHPDKQKTTALLVSIRNELYS